MSLRLQVVFQRCIDEKYDILAQHLQGIITLRLQRKKISIYYVVFVESEFGCLIEDIEDIIFILVTLF
jgi:hypothetical protein